MIRGIPNSVVFDLDGVLVDSISVMRDAYAIAVSSIPDAPPFEAYRSLLGRSLPDIANNLGLPAAFCQEYLAARYARLDQIDIQPGVRDVLHSLRRTGFSIGVATGKEGSDARAVLGRLGLINLIDVVVGGDETIAAKPSPVHILTVIDGLPGGPHLPERVVVVGDADADMVSARDAGCISVFAAWGYGDSSSLTAQPDFVLRKPLEIIEVIEGLRLERHAD